MSEHVKSKAPPSWAKGSQVQPGETHGPPALAVREDIDVVIGVTPLSADQTRTAHSLRRLFQSLCGGQPGQYWPQALLDSAGRFSRPTFPGGDHKGRQ